jgi:hypothetical protein
VLALRLVRGPVGDDKPLLSKGEWADLADEIAEALNAKDEEKAAWDEVEAAAEDLEKHTEDLERGTSVKHIVQSLREIRDKLFDASEAVG